MNSNKDRNYKDINSVWNINELIDIYIFSYKNSYFLVKVKNK